MKKQLAMQLSKLKTVDLPQIKLEQYQTDSNIVAEILIIADYNKDINNKIVVDLGCGNGIFGIGALSLGAKKVYFVDLDNNSINVTKINSKDFKNLEFFNCNISDFNKKVDTVIMNPPFGVQNRKADKKFLEKAFEISDKIYSIHKIESEKFIETISKEYGFKVLKIIPLNMQLKKSYNFHKKKMYKIGVGLWILSKNELYI